MAAVFWPHACDPAPRFEGGRRHGTPSGYISTADRTGQAAGRWSLGWELWSLVMAVALVAGCSSPPPVVQPSDDELVGAPEPDTATVRPPRHGALWYRIESQDRQLQVRVRLLDPPPTATFFFPGPWAGHDDFDDRLTIEDVRGEGSDASLPVAIDHREGRIDVETDGDGWLELSYRVELDAAPRREHRFVPWHRGDEFFAYAPTILVMPSSGIAERLRDIPVELHLPSEWTVASTWPVADHDQAGNHPEVTGFVADDVRTLRDAFVGAGRNWQQVTSHHTGTELRLTLTDEFQFDGAELLEVTSQITEHFLERFGGYDQVSALAMPLDHRQDHHDAPGGTGRRGGFVVEVPPDQPLDEELIVLVAHEAFHMWNGHQLVAGTDTEAQTEWFKEGVTHYIGLKTVARLGLIEERQLREELARTVRHYHHSLATSGGRYQTIHDARLPYDRGLLIALALELALFETTGGAVELEDWIELLLTPEYRDDAEAYDPRLLRNSFAALTGEFGSAPLNRYDALVTHQQPIDVSSLLEQLGLHLLESDRGATPRLLPIENQTRPFDHLFSPREHHGGD